MAQGLAAQHTNQAAAVVSSPPDLFLRSPNATYTATQWEQLSHGHCLQITRVQPDGELVSPTLPFRAPIAAFIVGADYTTT